jgi:hypothetical protein
MFVAGSVDTRRDLEQYDVKHDTYHGPIVYVFYAGSGEWVVAEEDDTHAAKSLWRSPDREAAVATADRIARHRRAGILLRDADGRVQFMTQAQR